MRSNRLNDDIPGRTEMLVNGILYKKGDKLRLMPGTRRSDAADTLLKGRIATIETIYEDYDNKIYLAVTLDDDPGQALFRDMHIYRYFLPDEVEPITYEEG